MQRITTRWRRAVTQKLQKICHLFGLTEQNTEEGRVRLCFIFARHYGGDAGCTACGQTRAHNAHWKRINSSASRLLKQEFGGDQSASGRSHVAASLCSKVTVVAKTLLISAPEVSHPVVLLRRFQHAITSNSDYLQRSRADMGVHYLIHAISTINNLIYLLQSWRDILKLVGRVQRGKYRLSNLLRELSKTSQMTLLCCWMVCFTTGQ